jgi:hypothetical protein
MVLVKLNAAKHPTTTFRQKYDLGLKVKYYAVQILLYKW